MIEYIAVIFGILSVWYAQKNKVLVFPTGIISVFNLCVFKHMKINYMLIQE